MTSFALSSLFALAATLTLAGCGHSDKANDAVTAENVEMPAEEAMSGVEPAAVPAADPSATATAASATTPSVDAAAAAAGSAAADVTAAASSPPAKKAP